MKTTWLISTAVFSLAGHVLSGTGEALAHANNDSEAKHHAMTQRAFEQEAAADYVVTYSTDGKLNIGVGRTDRQGVHRPIVFSPEELERFFDRQKNRQLIVVVIAKNVWSDDELQRHVQRLRDYFVARGYKKVVIQQGSGASRGIHLEHETKPTAEQPADAAGQQARIGVDLSFTLPDGCIHKPARGFDSLPGHIYARGSKFEIHYDVGDPGAGLSRIKEWKAQKLETKRIPLPANLGEGYLRVIDADRKWVVFATTSDIVFEAELKDDEDFAVFSAIVSSLRKVQPQPPQNPEAGAGQPATRPVVEPEGGQKPQLKSEGSSR